MSWYVFFHYFFFYVLNQQCLTNHFLSSHPNRTSNQAVDARCLLQTSFPVSTANNTFLNFPVPDMYKPMSTICHSVQLVPLASKKTALLFSQCALSKPAIFKTSVPRYLFVFSYFFWRHRRNDLFFFSLICLFDYLPNLIVCYLFLFIFSFFTYSYTSCSCTYLFLISSLLLYICYITLYIIALLFSTRLQTLLRTPTSYIAVFPSLVSLAVNRMIHCSCPFSIHTFGHNHLLVFTSATGSSFSTL